ncbi:ATP-dependent exoDNAse (exonuclease V) beta subunit [Neolewinella xylanilytica]|uniref:DNA 3'-5' helicase n=2 Tax=Neolewinella xylanilytica TaxID=1514080 RepID=A0A2S6I6C2_9BACT|nr:ATP-dependent exoDNAse (exonuclease V) beta subunit [Neolewinella xylanilytica]
MPGLLNNLKLISAGAGSGKTYRLTLEMAALLTSGEVRPEGIIATTFTKRAAAELKERVRVKLLREGMTREAGELSNALIGTVHGLGVKLLRRFAFEAGVSPQVDIIADGDHQRLFNLSMAAVISLGQIQEIEALVDRLSLSTSGEKYNWRKDVLGLVEVIRGNNFTPADIERSKTNSWQSLQEFLPPVDTNLSLSQYRTRAERILKETFEALLDNEADGTKKTDTAAQALRSMLGDLKQRGYLPWVNYAKLGRFAGEVGAKSRDLVTELVELGERHASLADFQEDLRRYQEMLFDFAQASIEEYDSYKKRRGRIDYTDMEVLVLRLLENDSVRETLSRELDLLMVDEFQDTSPIQLAIFLQLSQLAKQSVWVGDPKQSIYGFRGAEPRLMAAVMHANGPIDPANIQRKSWRSREDIVYACNSLFVSAFPEFTAAEVALEPVRTRRGSRFSPQESEQLSETHGLIHWHFTPEGKTRHSNGFMIATLVKAIRELLANPHPVLPKGGSEERKLRAGDIAILCRSNYRCADVAAELAKQGIPAAIARKGLLETAEATLLLACLKYMLDGTDSLSIAEIMLFGSRRDLPDIIDHRLHHLEYDPKAAWGTEEAILGQLESLREATAEHSTSEIINLVVERIDLRRIAAGWGDGEQRLANIDELRRLAMAYEENCHQQHRAASLGGYLLYLNQLIREGEDMQGASERPDAVNVLTYHRSKGLEWPVVVCFDLDQALRADVWGRAVVPDDPSAPVDLRRPLADRWLRYWVNPYGRLSSGIPWVDALEESRHKAATTEAALAEEARLLYVGMTRARDFLVLPTSQRNGAPWVDRVFARGGKATPVLAPDTTETPFTWNDVDVDKSFHSWTEPASQPAAEMSHHPIRFIDSERPGRSPYASRVVDDAFLAEYFGESRPGITLSYFQPPELDPATDGRILARCLSIFLAGDPRDAASMAYRTELAGDLLMDWAPGGSVDPTLFPQQSDSFAATLAEHWPDATVRRQLALRGTCAGRGYEKKVDWLLQTPGGECILLLDVCQSAKQLPNQLGARMAELRLQARLLGATSRFQVTTAFLHPLILGQLIEVKL